MAHKFAEIAFTPTVRSMQLEEGSRAAYASMDQGDDRTLVVYKLIKDLALYLPATLMDRLVHNIEALAPHQVIILFGVEFCCVITARA